MRGRDYTDEEEREESKFREVLVREVKQIGPETVISELRRQLFRCVAAYQESIMKQAKDLMRQGGGSVGLYDDVLRRGVTNILDHAVYGDIASFNRAIGFCEGCKSTENSPATKP